MGRRQTSYATWHQDREQNKNLKQDAPLGDLDTDDYRYASFIYPMDLGAPGSGKDHYVVFHINETTMTNFRTRNRDGTFTQNGPITRTEPTIRTNANIDSQANEGTSTNAARSFAANVTGTTSGTETGSLRRSIFDAVKVPITRVATTIVLYMPDTISASYQARWEAEDLGAASDFTNLVKGTGSKSELLKSALAGAAKELGSDLNGQTNLNLSGALSAASRTAINNHQEVIFNGIGFRQFQFNFRFMPQSEDEAVNVDNIIRAFKFYAAPEVLPGTAGRFWLYPAEFDIQYYANGEENEFLNKISTCALSDMQVNYTAAGRWSGHRPHATIKGSPPVCTDILLTFHELEIMTKRRVLSGY